MPAPRPIHISDKEEQKYRTDRHNNPIAFTCDLAVQAALQFGKDYVTGDSFTSEGRIYFTAQLLRDPIDLSILILNKVGFYTSKGAKRWDYIAMPPFVWLSLDTKTKIKTIQFMYRREGGVSLEYLFIKALSLDNKLPIPTDQETK